MSILGLHIVPSEQSNDHQVRLMVDGVDILVELEDDSLGLDPVEFFDYEKLLPNQSAAAVILGRCSCGVVGCGDFTATIARQDHQLVWNNFNPSLRARLSIVFELDQYTGEIERARNDHSWENVERRAERLISGLNFDALKSTGLKFVWASGRIGQQRISVCFTLEERGAYQIVVNAAWDHQAADEAVTIVTTLLRKSPSEWPDVIYYPLAQNLPRPNSAGTGWKQG